MRFNPDPLEQTTAATDLVLAVVAFGCALSLILMRCQEPWPIKIWSSAFLLLAVASLLGAIAHGIQMTASVNRLIWHPLNLALGLTVILFVVGSIYDGWGVEKARRMLPLLIGIGVVFFVMTWFISQSFYLFIPYAGLGLLFALGVYVQLTLSHRLAGARWIALGIVVTLIAAVIQASRSVAFTFIWPFDHRALLHLIQVPGLLLMVMGVRLNLLTSRVE